MAKFFEENNQFNTLDISADGSLNKRVTALKEFKHQVASSLLKFTDANNDKEIEARLSASLLFLIHISQEIVKGFANSDPELENELFNEASKQAKRAYKSNFKKEALKYLH